MSRRASAVAVQDPFSALLCTAPEMIPDPQPRNDPQIDPEMNPISLHVDPEMIPN